MKPFQVRRSLYLQCARVGSTWRRTDDRTGRSIVGNAGALLTKVLVEKAGDTKNFAIVDAAMNDLLRPALYSAWQNIVEVSVLETLKNTPTILWVRFVKPVISSVKSVSSRA